MEEEILIFYHRRVNIMYDRNSSCQMMDYDENDRKKFSIFIYFKKKKQLCESINFGGNCFKNIAFNHNCFENLQSNLVDKELLVDEEEALIQALRFEIRPKKGSLHGETSRVPVDLYVVVESPFNRSESCN